MDHQIKEMLGRLNNPSVILSLVSQVVQILFLVGINVNQKTVLSVMTAACSIFVTLGVLSNPDTESSGYADDIYPCSATGKLEKHVTVAGELVCQEHGAVYTPKEQTPAAPQ